MYRCSSRTLVNCCRRLTTPRRNVGNSKWSLCSGSQISTGTTCESIYPENKSQRGNGHVLIQKPLNQVNKVISLPSQFIWFPSCNIRRNFSTNKNTTLNFEEFRDLLNSEDIQVIDVREPDELETDGRIPDAINIPLGQLKKIFAMDDTLFMQKYKVVKPQKHDLNIVFVGLGPIKSGAALAIAHKIGFKHARHYGGGFMEWSSKMKSQE